MKIVQLWHRDRPVVVVKSIKDENKRNSDGNLIFPEGSVCVNEHYLYEPKHKWMIQDVSDKEKEIILDYERQISEYKDKIKGMREELNKYLKKIYRRRELSA
jgi:hypothetical protein